MKTELANIFTVNREKNSIYITREFTANLRLVWDAWTKPEILDHWWAPKPYHVETKKFEFREGGMWLYAMVGPENDIHWSKAEYKKIVPLKQFVWQDAFTDENGNIDTKMPRSLWTNTFTEEGGITSVNSILEFEKPADLEMLIKMGFEEGLGMGFKNLDEVLTTL